MPNFPPSNSWVIFITFISSCTTAIAHLFVPWRALKVAVFMSFLSCYFNHVLIDKSGICHPLPSKPCRQFFSMIQHKSCSPEEGALTQPTQEQRTSLERNFSQNSQDLPWCKATSKERVLCDQEQITWRGILSRSLRHDMAALLECLVCFSRVCSFS